jgi:hypothetical protein
MKDIDLLEHGGGNFVVMMDGEFYPLRDPRDLHYQVVLACLQTELPPGAPDMLDWQRVVTFHRWRAAWDLPVFRDAQRLAYLVDHYRPAVAYDLTVHCGLDLGDLWRERRWTRLLDLIDRLPSHSQYAAAASMDEEHAEMLAEALAARAAESDDDKNSGPALTGWTPEVAVMTNVLDAVRQVTHAIVAVNSEKGKTPESPKPAPRPVTPLERAMRRAEFQRKKGAHERLVARLLPHKANPTG